MGKYPTKPLGKTGVNVSAIGFGAMGMSFAYGPRQSEEESFKVLTHAADMGVTFWDTADVYGYGHSEELIGKWFKKTGRRNEIFLATKFGHTLDGHRTGKVSVRGDKEYVKQACDESLKRLGIDQIDLYYLHRADKSTPIEETVGAMAELVKEGKVKYIGLSEISSDTLRRAHKVHPITAVQVEYSPWALDIENPQIALLKTCRELGVAIVAYSPLGRGFLTGQIKSRDDFADDDFRKISPRFSEENFHKNLELVHSLKKIAEKKGCTAGQLSLAWLLAQGDDVTPPFLTSAVIIPIPGTRSVDRLEENSAAVEVKLTKEEVEEVRKLVESTEVFGDRYPPMMQGNLFADTPLPK